MKKVQRFKKLRFTLAAIAASGVMGISGLAVAPSVYADTFNTNVETARTDNFFVEIEGTFSTVEKQKILDRLNEIRLEACKNGYPNYNYYTGEPDPSNPLTMDDYHELTWSNTMETLARIRAVELTINADHFRPNSLGELYSDLSYDNHVFNAFENGSWYPSLMGAIESWYAEKDMWLGKKSGYGGHYMQLIKPENKYVGIATFTNPNTDNKNLSTGTSLLFCEDQNQPIVYIDTSTGEFVTQKPYTMPTGDTDQTGVTGKHTQIIEVADKHLQSLVIEGSTSLDVKKTAQLSLTANMQMTASEYGVSGTVIKSTGTVHEGVKWSSSDTSVLKVDSNGKITAVKEGKATVTAEVAGKKATVTITVKPETIAITSITLDNIFKYPEIGETVTYVARIEPENATNKKLTWSSDKPEIAAVDNNGNVTAKKKGTAHITVTTEDGSKFARGIVNVKDNRTGVYYVDDQWVYLKSGKIDTDFTGLIYGNDQWYYMTNGVQDKKYVGLTQYNGSWWYIKNGTIDKSFTGIVEYNKNNWYVRNGKVEKSYTGLVYSGNTWWYVTNAFHDKSYKGLTRYNDNWWYVNNGTINKSYVGLVLHDGVWWYVRKGSVAKDFTGIVLYNGNNWYVKEGKVDKSYTGLVYYDSDWWYVEKGFVNKAYKGLVYCNSKWWYISNAHIDRTFNSLVSYNGKWWYIKDGTIDKSFKGLFKYNGNLWYVVNGAVDKTHNGKASYNGKTVTVKDGWGGKA